MFILKLIFITFSVVCLLFLLRLFLYRTALIFLLRKWIQWIQDRVHVHQHFRVPEFNHSTHQENHFYRRLFLYLNSLPSLEDSDYTNLFSGRKPNDIVLSLDAHRPIHDVFLGARLSWTNEIREDSTSFVLRIKKKDKRRILKPYLQHIHAVSDDIDQRGKELKIYACRNGRWNPLPFNHPATFESLVMDPDLKAKIRSDLESFLKSKQYYHKIGRVWRRSYLLYGPSGTGKSSFVAATANLLSFDVYNLNLSQVMDDADLDALLLQTRTKSLIVIEDLDRFVSERSKERITWSGLLNFMDGISNSMEERIMMFTMNGKEGINSELLRPGRIDMHVYFPLCDFNSFKSLANSYLGVKEHKLFQQVEEIFQSGATMSPAEMSELMLVNRNSPSRALKSVISALQSSSRYGGKIPGVRLSDSTASSPAPPSMSEEVGGAAWKETVPKEFRKLYGLLKMKSCKRPGSFDHESDTILR